MTAEQLDNEIMEEAIDSASLWAFLMKLIGAIVAGLVLDRWLGSPITGLWPLLSSLGFLGYLMLSYAKLAQSEKRMKLEEALAQRDAITRKAIEVNKKATALQAQVAELQPLKKKAHSLAGEVTDLRECVRNKDRLLEEAEQALNDYEAHAKKRIASVVASARATAQASASADAPYLQLGRLEARRSALSSIYNNHSLKPDKREEARAEAKQVREEMKSLLEQIEE